MGIGIMTFPVYLPLLAIKYGLSGTMIGCILCVPALMQIVSIPFITKYGRVIGVEKTVFSSGIFYGVGFVAFGLSTLIEEPIAFFWMAIGAQVVVGFSLAANIVGEQALLLRYSLKSEREKNLGMFRAASGAGGMLAPMLGTAMYALGGFMAAFLYVGIGYLLISPFIYFQLYKAKELYFQEGERMKN